MTISITCPNSSILTVYLLEYLYLLSRSLQSFKSVHLNVFLSFKTNNKRIHCLEVETNMSTTFHIYSRDIQGVVIYIYVSYMKSAASMTM